MRFQTQLWHEQLRNHLQGILINAAAVIGLAVVLRNARMPWIASWATVALALCALRMLLHLACQRYVARHPDAAPPTPQRVLLAAGLLTSATLWALVAGLGLPVFSVSEQFTVLIILSALAGGSTGTLASMPIAGKVYVAIVLVPCCTRLLLLDDEKLNVLGWIGLLFTLVMFNGHNNNYRVLRTTLALTGDKEELIRQLSEKNQQISQVNDDLEKTVAARTAQLEYRANHDPLTGLLNRRGFLSYPFAYRDSERHKTLIFIDLDHFKDINDGMGHAFGDALLQAVAARLTEVMADMAQASAAADHALCRWGGDEFVACITRAADQPGASAADYQRMHARLSRPLQAGQHTLEVGMSVGIFERTTCAEFDLHQALIYADIAAADAKKQGRGRLSFFSARSYELQQRRLQLTLALAHAHQDGSLRLLFQPIVATHDASAVAYEALLRWTHPELGAVGPDEFIPLAENANAILAIGRWVLEQACDSARAWPVAPGGNSAPKVAVNTSIRQLIQPDFADLVAATLARSGLAPARLVVEVTESVLDDRNMADALTTLTALHALGVEIHLDDFGTGYSSLSRLRQLPLDAIKIDKSFVMQMDEKSAAVIEATVLIANRYGLRVIAEGVEPAAQLAILRTQGIDELQGYYFGRPGALPLPAPEAG